MTKRDKSGKFLSAQQKGTIQMSDTNGTVEVKPMLTLSQAVAYMKDFDPKINKQRLKAILESTRNSAIFVAGETIRVTHFHDEVSDLIEVAPSALQAYIDAKAHGTVGQRAIRAGRPRKYILYIPDAVSADALASLDTYADQGVRYEAAYKMRAKKVVAEQHLPVPQPDEIEELISA